MVLRGQKSPFDIKELILKPFMNGFLIKVVYGKEKVKWKNYKNENERVDYPFFPPDF